MTIFIQTLDNKVTFIQVTSFANERLVMSFSTEGVNDLWPMDAPRDCLGCKAVIHIHTYISTCMNMRFVIGRYSPMSIHSPLGMKLDMSPPSPTS